MSDEKYNEADPIQQLHIDKQSLETIVHAQHAEMTAWQQKHTTIKAIADKLDEQNKMLVRRLAYIRAQAANLSPDVREVVLLLLDGRMEDE